MAGAHRHRGGPGSVGGVLPRGQYDQGEAHLPGPSIWPIVVAVGAAVALPGSIHNLPSEVQIGLIVPGIMAVVLGLIAWIDEDRLAPAHAARRRLIMALADRPTPYSPPTTGRRSETEASLHLRTLREIARLRFNFPTGEHGVSSAERGERNVSLVNLEKLASRT